MYTSPFSIPVQDHHLTSTQTRAAQVVLAAELAGAVPPKAMDVDALSSQVRAPDVAELNTVWNIQRFSRAVERQFTTDTRMKLPRDRQGKENEGPEDTARMGEWRRGVRKTIYLTLIAGAALAGIYQEPLHALEENDEELGERVGGILLPQEPEEFAQTLTVLQTLTTLEQDMDVFSFLDQWLLRHLLNDRDALEEVAHRFRHGYGRAKTCPGTAHCQVSLKGGHSHVEAHYIVWELMKMLWMAHKIHEILSQNEVVQRGKDGDVDGDVADGRAPAPPPSRGCAVVVPMRYFAAVSADVAGDLCVADPTTKSLSRAFELLEYVNSESGQPTHMEEGLQVAPLWVKFFEHFLRRHFGLAFIVEFFDHYEALRGVQPSGFEAALSRTLGLFALDDVAGRAGFAWTSDLCCADFLGGPEILECAGRAVTYYSMS